MESKELEKHIAFLHRYACENKILFRVSRSGVSVEDISREIEEATKGANGQ